MRLFVAVKFSPEIEKSLTDIQDKMKKNKNPDLHTAPVLF